MKPATQRVKRLLTGLLKPLEGKDKFVPVLFLTEHYAMKAYWGMEV
jgi:hypothetical protein